MFTIQVECVWGWRCSVIDPKWQLLQCWAACKYPCLEQCTGITGTGLTPFWAGCCTMEWLEMLSDVIYIRMTWDANCCFMSEDYLYSMNNPWDIYMIDSNLCVICWLNLTALSLVKINVIRNMKSTIIVTYLVMIIQSVGEISSSLFAVWHWLIDFYVARDIFIKYAHMVSN